MNANKFRDPSVPLISQESSETITLADGKTNLVVQRVPTPEERVAATKPKHPVRHEGKGLVEELSNPPRILINRSSRHLARPGDPKYWLLRTQREWWCGGLSRMVEVGEMVQCADAPDYHTLTHNNGAQLPFCVVIEEVHA